MAAFSAVMAMGFGAATVACIWTLICNERTSRQRGDLIEWAFDKSAPTAERWRRQRTYEAVSYDQHLWALCLLRDPAPLYEAAYERVGA